jgi:hypothetical protein
MTTFHYVYVQYEHLMHFHHNFQLITDLVYFDFHDRMSGFKTSYDYQFSFQGVKLAFMGPKYFSEVRGEYCKMSWQVYS